MCGCDYGSWPIRDREPLRIIERDATYYSTVAKTRTSGSLERRPRVSAASLTLDLTAMRGCKCAAQRTARQPTLLARLADSRVRTTPAGVRCGKRGPERRPGRHTVMPRHRLIYRYCLRPDDVTSPLTSRGDVMPVYCASFPDGNNNSRLQALVS